MHVSVEQSGDLERKMTVEVPEDRIADQVKERLQELSRTVKVDGFRPGKVPFSVVRQRYGARVREEILGDVLRSSISEAMTEQDLRPVGEPSIEPGNFEVGKGLSYVATFEVYPTVALDPVENLNVERPACEIAEPDVEKMIGTLREQHKTWLEVARSASDGDQITIDFVGEIDGEPFEGGTASEFELIIGAGNMIDGFEEGLVGKAATEPAELNLKFPDAYQNEGLAGKDVTFKVTVNRVSESVLPVLDDEFFAKFGVDNGGLEAFQTEIRENMERERDRALKQRFNSNVLDQVNEANELAIPQALIQQETMRMQQQAMQTMMQRGGNVQDFDPSKMMGIFEEPAKKRVKLGLLMAEMIKSAGISADPGKVRGTIESMASSYEDSAAVVKWYYEDPQRLHEIEAMCLEDEAVAWIVARAKVNEVSISFDDLMNPGQTDQ
ncbi:MAG: trigger factor [Gammaproteobacteria bacterium]|jgi:trigger factor